MDINEFLQSIYKDVKAAQSDPSSEEGFAESIFTEMIMSHMSEIGMSHDATVCHYEGNWGNAKLKLSGYAFSDDHECLDLFVSQYNGLQNVTTLPDSAIKKSAEQCIRFLIKAAEGKLSDVIPSHLDVHDLVLLIEDLYDNLDQIRIFILSDGQTKSKSFSPQENRGKLIQLEVLDIERLYNHLSAGKPKDEIVFNVIEAYKNPLPCVFIPDENDEYEYALTALPGDMLRFLYEKYGDRLLETNVRSFLSQRGKVNKGIRDTVVDEPSRFMAYNNGVVIVVDEIKLEKNSEGHVGLAWLKGIQIVNGGQTTASLFFTKRKLKNIDLGKVRVAAKIIVIKNESQSEVLISKISKYANSQNIVRQADLSSNKPFHIEFEKQANSCFCSDGVSRWFYERSSGSYNVMLTRQGNTPGKLKKIKNEIPNYRKITKTDLAKYLFAWELKPHLVSLGGQKNFIAFMGSVEERELDIDQEYYKNAISKVILFKETQKICRKAFVAFQGNVTNYTVSMFSSLHGNDINLDMIWDKQKISDELGVYLTKLAHQIKSELEDSCGERMLSEWAKKPQCWTDIQGSKYDPAPVSIPELS
jgi:hypothetical protein